MTLDIEALAANATVELTAEQPPPFDEELYTSAPGDDAGNAKVVAARYAERIHYVPELGWLWWNGVYHECSGKAEAQVTQAIIDTLYQRKWAAYNKDPEFGIPKYKAIFRKCDRADNGIINACRNLLQAEVMSSLSDFDNDPDLLNVANGVIDLRTGILNPPSPIKKFTYACPVEYKPDADCGYWCHWLNEAIGDEQLVKYIQTTIGYSLTGHTREEILLYLYGPPRSGKGTFTETILAMLGQPLAKEVDFSMFTAQRSGDDQNFDLAPLRPCRFVAASESNSYERFNAAKVKRLTGGNEVYCAFKRRTHFNYKPQYKIWLSSNEPINANPDDEAVWGRIRVIEFPESYLGKENKGLKARMKTPEILQGVLAWAVAGAIQWYGMEERGLPELDRQQKTKRSQRDELDHVEQWIEECCERGDYFTASAKLYQSYKDWCIGNGVEPKRQNGFARTLKFKGIPPHRNASQRGYKGVQVKMQ